MCIAGMHVYCVGICIVCVQVYCVCAYVLFVYMYAYMLCIHVHMFSCTCADTIFRVLNILSDEESFACKI